LKLGIVTFPHRASNSESQVCLDPAILDPTVHRRRVERTVDGNLILVNKAEIEVLTGGVLNEISEVGDNTLGTQSRAHIRAFASAKVSLRNR
jgi:hypothetical protein